MVSSNGILVSPEQSFITTRLNAIKATIKRYRKNFAIASHSSLFCILSPCSIFLSQLFIVIKKNDKDKNHNPNCNITNSVHLSLVLRHTKRKGANNPVFAHSEVSPNTFVPQIRKACTCKVQAFH